MALITTLQCSCGREWLIYVPKKLLYKEIFRGGGVELGKLMDEQKERRGEIALAQEGAELRGVKFRDISISEIIQCDDCGRVFDMLRIIDLDIKYPGVLDYQEVKVAQYEA
ncbi:hypothetical protein ES702_02545 [subsurface metagenome]